MWGRMRMTPTDLSDVNAHTYTYLMNGTTALGNWTGLFRSGEKVRLRFINGSAMTYFDVRIPGLKMTVVAADGQYMHPVTVDEFRIAVAETFDVIVEPSGQDAYTIFAQDMGRTGYARGTLAVREGLRAPLPAARPAADPDHGRHGPRRNGPRRSRHVRNEGHGRRLWRQHGHERHGRRLRQRTWPAWTTAPAACRAIRPAKRAIRWSTCRPWRRAPSWTIPASACATTAAPCSRMARLKSLFDDPDGREPGREIELHLTGHMEKFAWSFDGSKFSGRRAAAAQLRRAHAHRAGQRHDDDPPDPPARHVERRRGRARQVPPAQAHRRHAAWNEAQLPRPRRCARPMGVPLPPALPHGSRNDARSEGGGMSTLLRSIPLGGLALRLGLAMHGNVLAQDHSQHGAPAPASGNRIIQRTRNTHRRQSRPATSIGA